MLRKSLLVLSITALSCSSLTKARADNENKKAAPPVTVTQTATSYTLANGFVTATVNKKTGDLTSLKYHGLELTGYGSGYPAGHWEQDPSNAPKLTDSITINPKDNGGARAEVSVKGISNGKVELGHGPGGGTLCNIEIRYSLGRNDHGVYTYAIFSHPASYPATRIGESRFDIKLNGKVFDWMTIDSRRNKKMASGYDWAHGIPLNMKEARRLTTGIYKGKVEHKYDYTAIQFNTPAYGWSSTSDHIGIWFINPSYEYLSGGPTKVELTGHIDLTNVGQPVLLDYWRGTHYGGSECVIKAGQNWNKVVGPIFVYCNSGDSPDAMWHNALDQAKTQEADWPYNWVRGINYPHKHQRANVSGRIVLDDPQAPNEHMSHLLVGLAKPPYTVKGWRGRQTTVTWQNDAKHYEFWTRGNDDGQFTIKNVRPGTYTLYAIADGVLGQFSKADITVKTGETLKLGSLDWKPVRYGRQLWSIGIPNRSAEEFAHGQNYWHWGRYLKYAQWFPHDVNYTIGKSDFRKDWNFEQVPRVENPPANGRARGTSTTWTINFDLPKAPHGLAVLRLAIVGVGTRHLDVTVNGKQAGELNDLRYNATINRDGIRGLWVEKDVRFNADLMKAGHNTMKLTIPPGWPTSGIMYDYLRLALNEAAKPPAQNK